MKRFLGLGILIVALGSLKSFAETSVESYIKNLGAVKVSGKGGIALPPAVYSSLAGNKVSKAQQFVISHHIMNSCVRKVIETVPDTRAPYIEAKKMYDDGICKLSRCYQQAMLISLLPMMVGVAGTGSAQGMMAQMLTGSQSDTCQGDGAAFDPALVNLVKNTLGK